MSSDNPGSSSSLPGGGRGETGVASGRIATLQRLGESVIMPQNASDAPSPAHFPTTRWNLVLQSGNPQAPLARESLAELCGSYWYPLYAYIRRRGYAPDEASDLTQDFFARALEKGLLAEADPTRGRFRAFLRTVCAHFLANRRDWDQARKRGGGRTLVPIDSLDAEGRYARELADELTPERIYDRSWALTLLGRVLDRLGQEYAAAGKAAIFEALRGMLSGDPEVHSYGAVAAHLSITEGAARVAAHRLRGRYGELLRQEIAATLAEPADVDDEIQALFMALAS